MTGRITKIKQSSDGRTVIRTVVGEGTNTEKETLFKSSVAPHDDFFAVFRELVTHARDILEFPDQYAKDRVSITGVSFSMSEAGVEGAVLSGQVQLMGVDAPFVFNTPHMPFAQYSETGEAALMPDDAQDALERLRDEAEAYMEGKRRDGDLFFEDGKKTAAGKMAAAEQGATP